jgi:hypothetical protein
MNRAEFWESSNVVYIYRLTKAHYIQSFWPAPVALLPSTESQRSQSAIPCPRCCVFGFNHFNFIPGKPSFSLAAVVIWNKRRFKYRNAQIKTD